MAQAGGIRVSMQGVHCHESVVAVQCVGLRAMSAMASNEEVAALVLKEGGVDAVFASLRLFNSDPPTTAAASLALVRLTRQHPVITAGMLPDDWEALCEKAVVAYGSTFSIADHIHEAVPVLRQYYEAA